MNLEMSIEPWFHYPVEGGSPALHVALKTKKMSATLVWSTRFERFSKGWETMNFRRANPGAFRQAVESMRDFCSKVQHPRTVTQPVECVTESCDSVTAPTEKPVTVSRAQGPSAKENACHSHRSRDVDVVTRDSDSSALKLRTITVTGPTAEAARAKDKARLSADPRFAAWAAGAPAAPAAAVGTGEGGGGSLPVADLVAAPGVAP